MAPMSPPAMTPMLRLSIEHRIEELEHTKEAFKRRYHLNTNRFAETNTLKRLSKLIDDIKNDPGLEDDDFDSILLNFVRYIEQAQHDRSMCEATLLKLEKQVWNKLDNHLSRIDVSCLHVDLMKESMNAESSIEAATAHLETTTLEDEFEVVENGAEEPLKAFEKTISTPGDVDIGVLDVYLSSLFETEEDNQLLQDIKSRMKEHGDEISRDRLEVDNDCLVRTIKDLRKNNLIDPAKLEVLKGYLQTPKALEELAATLEMRSFRYWNYKTAGTGLCVTPRQDINGEYCIVLDEDIIDMIFLHYTASGWSSKLKEVLQIFLNKSSSLAPNAQSDSEQKRRSYFLDPPPPVSPEQHSCPCSMCHTYPSAAPMPPPPPMQHLVNHGCCPLPPAAPPSAVKRNRKKVRTFHFDEAPPPPPPLPPAITRRNRRKAKNAYYDQVPPPPPWPYNYCDALSSQRKKDYERYFFMSRLPTQGNRFPGVSNRNKIQARLIKTLAFEAKLREAFDGEVHVRAAKFKSFASSLPHKTVITVMAFLGVPSIFLDLFSRFLNTKVHVGLSREGTPARVLERQCGVPFRHSLEVLFTEAVLFFLELAILKTTGSYLYRLYEHCYFVGTQKQGKIVDEKLSRFAGIMGLKLDGVCTPHKLSIGFLTMETQLSSYPDSSVSFQIDNDAVSAYAYGVKTSLNNCTTVLDWIRVWNKTAGTYAAHLFGPLAEVFGSSHLEAVTAAYNQIHSIIFDSSNLTSYVKSLINTHIERSAGEPPFALESLIYLPQSNGGLGVKNPFVTFSRARNFHSDPATEFQRYLENEGKYYDAVAEEYSLWKPGDHQRKLESIFDNDSSQIAMLIGNSQNPDNPQPPFLTKAELTVHRESAPYVGLPYKYFHTHISVPSLVNLYHDLIREPVNDVEADQNVTQALERIAEMDNMYWHELSGEDRWMLQLYGDECFERYGTLEIWWAAGVPIEAYKMFRN